MQWLIDLVLEAIGGPPFYIDRGDPQVPDWTQLTLTIDGNWHDLDVSGIVPANASAIIFGCAIVDDIVGQEFLLRKSGKTSEITAAFLKTQVANIVIPGNLIVATSPNELVEYRGWVGINVIVLTVKAWWI